MNVNEWLMEKAGFEAAPPKGKPAGTTDLPKPKKPKLPEEPQKMSSAVQWIYEKTAVKKVKDDMLVRPTRVEGNLAGNEDVANVPKWGTKPQPK